MKGYKNGIRRVKFGRKIVIFHKPGTKAFKAGQRAKRLAGKRLAKLAADLRIIKWQIARDHAKMSRVWREAAKRGRAKRSRR